MKNRFNILRNEASFEAPEGGGGSTPKEAAAPAAELAPWYTALGEDFAPHHKTLANHKGDMVPMPITVAKSLIHSQKTGPTYPDESATPEDVQRFHSLAKVPVEGSSMAYGLKIPEDASDDDKAIFERVAKVAHSSHVSAPGLQNIVKEYQAIVNEAIEKQEQEHKETIEADKRAYLKFLGKDAVAKDQTAIHTANKFADMAGLSPEHKDQLLSMPFFKQFAFGISRALTEDGISAPQGFGDLRSNQERANDIMSGKDSVWGDKFKNGTAEEQAEAYNQVKKLLSV